ncbi:hypothetical protein [Halapricum desulfuricans]|uniref:hypothetical protein n=1 Tax=Halapricum desulfuricans TaxID=2841257 RepID=UPI001E547776|nr:hypothetical protein [Halapricum desulfuricans]
MTEFNPLWSGEVNITHNNDSILVHFGDDTLGINPTSNGYSLTPDWNDRHFTLAFSEESVLYHLTREDKGEKRGSEGNIPLESFIAEIYLAVRSIAPLYPVEELDIDEIGVVDFEEMEDYLLDQNVISRTETGLTVDADKKKKLEIAYEESEKVREELLDRILTPLSADRIKDSGENIFVLPDEDYRPLILFLFPDGYIGVTRPATLFNSLDNMTVSRTFDLLIQTMFA